MPETSWALIQMMRWLFGWAVFLYLLRLILGPLIWLERVARQLGRPLVFIECGPDDKPSSS